MLRNDALNRRIANIRPDPDPEHEDKYIRTDFYYTPSWQIAQVRENDNLASKDTVATALKHEYIWDVRYIDAPLCRDENKNADNDCTDAEDDVLYYATDANFNVTAVVDTSGAVVERYAYDPYGQVTILNGADGADPDVDGETVFEWDPDADGVSDVDNRTLYAGYHLDTETGLYHVRYRYYHPTLGRWLSRDPIGYADGMSLYEYASSSPQGVVDPFGTDQVELHGTVRVCWKNGEVCLFEISKMSLWYQPEMPYIGINYPWQELGPVQWTEFPAGGESTETMALVNIGGHLVPAGSVTEKADYEGGTRGWTDKEWGEWAKGESENLKRTGETLQAQSDRMQADSMLRQKLSQEKIPREPTQQEIDAVLIAMRWRRRKGFDEMAGMVKGHLYSLPLSYAAQGAGALLGSGSMGAGAAMAAGELAYETISLTSEGIKNFTGAKDLTPEGVEKSLKKKWGAGELSSEKTKDGIDCKTYSMKKELIAT